MTGSTRWVLSKTLAWLKNNFDAGNITGLQQQALKCLNRRAA
jgi:hypothetical protein